MPLYFTNRERRRPVQLAAAPQIAQQVGHRGRLQQLRRPERQAANGSLTLIAADGGWWAFRAAAAETACVSLTKNHYTDN